MQKKLNLQNMVKRILAAAGFLVVLDIEYLKASANWHLSVKKTF